MCILFSEGLRLFIIVQNRPSFLAYEDVFLMRKILINVHILQDSFHVGIPYTKVNRGVQDISMWGLPKSCECHMALGLRTQSLSIQRDYPSIMERGPFVMQSIYPSLHLLPYFRCSLIYYHQVYLNGSVILDFYPLQLPLHSIGPSPTFAEGHLE